MLTACLNLFWKKKKKKSDTGLNECLGAILTKSILPVTPQLMAKSLNMSIA